MDDIAFSVRGEPVEPPLKRMLFQQRLRQNVPESLANIMCHSEHSEESGFFGRPPI